MPEAEAHPFERLSEQTRAALRLTFDRHMEAGEVARELDTPVETVRKRFARARAVLGVSSTKEAARLLAAHEGRLDQPRVYPPMAIPSEAGLAERRSPTTPSQQSAPRSAWWTRGNDLTTTQRLVVMVVIFFVLVVGFVLTVGFLQAFSSFWSQSRR